MFVSLFASSTGNRQMENLLIRLFRNYLHPGIIFLTCLLFVAKGTHALDWKNSEEFIANKICRQVENCDHITLQSTQLVTPTARSQSIWNVYAKESTSLSQKQSLGTALILANRKTSMVLLNTLFQSAEPKIYVY
jgi:hypothetical protein